MLNCCAGLVGRTFWLGRLVVIHGVAGLGLALIDAPEEELPCLAQVEMCGWGREPVVPPPRSATVALAAPSSRHRSVECDLCVAVLMRE